MQTKLTLRLEDQLIEQAKSYAAQAGKSVSQIVAEDRSRFTINTHNSILAGIIAGIEA
jgi:predicted HicB family RNase H-like nuclease